MIDPQTWLVAVAACVVIAAVWAWGIVREDAAVVRAHASGIEAGRALERSAARGAIVAGTTTGDPAPAMPRFGDVIDYEDRPSDVGVLDRGAGAQTGGGREIPAWLREPGGSEGRD